MQEIAWALVEKGVRRTGLSRRAFLRSTCGMAACLTAINQASAASAGSTVLPKDAILDRDAAHSVLAGDEFIFDIQTHHVQPARTKGWNMGGRYEYVKEIFLDSDTTVSVLSALPARRRAEVPARSRRGGDARDHRPDVESQAPARPRPGDAERATRRGAARRHAAPGRGAQGRGVEDLHASGARRGKAGGSTTRSSGSRHREGALKLGVKIVCTHKGLPLGFLGENATSAGGRRPRRQALPRDELHHLPLRLRSREGRRALRRGRRPTGASTA